MLRNGEYMIKLIIDAVLNVAIVVGCFLCVIMFSSIIYLANWSGFAQREHIREMYDNIVIQTGQIQDRLPFYIDDSTRINAYTDGTKVVMFQGMIDYCKNDDEIALILGHELAHVMLRHTNIAGHYDNDSEMQISEANADKMGAIYMMKAGYDVCSGREIWKRLRNDKGNYLGVSHPDYSYRYDELNINCD